MNLKIDESKFTGDVEAKFLFKLIDWAIEKAGGTSNLASILICKYKLKRYDERGLSDRLRKWQRKRLRIYLNYFLTIGRFFGYQDENLFSHINGLYYEFGRSPLMVGYPLKASKEFVILAECIRVEGNLQSNNLSFENTNTELTNLVKDNLLKLNFSKNSIREDLHIKIQVPKNVSDKYIKITNLASKTKINNFHHRLLKLKKGDKKEIIFMEKNFKYDKRLMYKIEYFNKNFIVDIVVPTSGKIICKSSLNENRYQKVCVSLKLSINNNTLANVLNQAFEIPFGNKSSV